MEVEEGERGAVDLEVAEVVVAGRQVVAVLGVVRQVESPAQGPPGGLLDRGGELFRCAAPEIQVELGKRLGWSISWPLRRDIARRRLLGKSRWQREQK